jgi:hypothetical protein
MAIAYWDASRSPFDCEIVMKVGIESSQPTVRVVKNGDRPPAAELRAIGVGDRGTLMDFRLTVEWRYKVWPKQKRGEIDDKWF